MLTTIRLILEVLGVAAIVLAALWVRDDSNWEPKITLLAGIIAYGQSLVGRTRAPTKKEIKTEFRSSLETYRSQWAAEKRLRSGKVDRAQNIAKNLQWNLSDLRAKLGTRFRSESVAVFEDIFHDLRSLEEHRMSLDGGVSYRAFWEAGDAVFSKVDSFLANL